MERLFITIYFLLYTFNVFSIDYDGLYIAHAGGGVENYTYTNSLESLNSSYEQGFRFFELDLEEGKLGKY